MQTHNELDQFKCLLHHTDPVNIGQTLATLDYIMRFESLNEREELFREMEKYELTDPDTRATINPFEYAKKYASRLVDKVEIQHQFLTRHSEIFGYWDENPNFTQASQRILEYTAEAEELVAQ